MHIKIIKQFLCANIYYYFHLIANIARKTNAWATFTFSSHFHQPGCRFLKIYVQLYLKKLYLMFLYISDAFAIATVHFLCLFFCFYSVVFVSVELYITR